MNPKEQIIETLKKWITQTNIISYDDRIGLDCGDKELTELRDRTTKEVYVVSFKTKSTNIEYNEKGEVVSFLKECTVLPISMQKH
ncbi:hypothetical protein [Flavobacterium nitrogenifigens]|uniref:hypothetical protein n=1 Tax=Flavobacterium nitrogenifigens TaxID=1617283 RepID=UPI001FCBA672|nr:hypothetical protein [Flavobacterium nitrogenifigens]